MKTPILSLFLLFVSLTLSAEYADKACKSIYCTEYEWYNNGGRFDPYSIKWPLHHTGDKYIDQIDGGHISIDVIYDDHKSSKSRADLGSFRKMSYCPDPWFLKDGIDMEKPFECQEESKTKPHWNESNCSLIATSYEDEYVYVDGPGCSKVLRRWVILDWCKYKPNSGAHNTDDEIVLIKDIPEHAAYFGYGRGHYGKGGVRDDGYYTFTQVLKIVDKDPPKLWSCEPMEIDLNGKCEDRVKIKNQAEDTGPCPGQKMEIGMEIYNQWGEKVFKSWFYTRHNEPFDVLTDKLVAGDYIIHWSVTDGCQNKTHCTQNLKLIDKTPPQLICIQNVSSSISDEDGVTIWAKDFVHKLDGPCFKGDITISFSPTEDQTGMHFDCNDELGVQEMRVYARDNHGNQTSCYVEFFISDHFACSEEMQIGGAIFNRFEEPLSGAIINVTKDESEVAFGTANARGNYNVKGIPLEKSTSYIKPSITDEKKQGIDEKDLLILLRHITGVEKFSNVMQYAAADINEDEKIDMQDYFLLIDIIYDLPQQDEPYNAWKFIDSKLFYAGLTKASKLTAPIPVRSFKHRYDIVGLKNGDIDYSWTTELSATSRSAQSGVYSQTAKNGQFEYALYISSGLSIFSIQLDASISDLTINGQPAEYVIKTDANTVDVLLPAGGKNALSFTSAKELSLYKVPALVGAENSGFRAVAFDFTKSAENIADAPIVSPNPFGSSISVEFIASEAQQSQFQLIDLTGKVVKRSTINLTKEYNKLTIDELGALPSGVYMFRISIDGNNHSQMIVKQ